jgi:uncharacterized membrane protein YfcA
MGLIAVATGVIAGTVLGRIPRRRVSERLFRRVVSGIVLVIGTLLLLQAAR